MCYWCGCLDHNDKQCKLWIQSKESLSVDKQQYGSFLRTAPYQRGSRNVFYVPGWFEKETSGEKNGEAAASEAGEVDKNKGSSGVLQLDLVTDLGGNITNSNSLSHLESATILGKVETVREAIVGNNSSPDSPSTNFSERTPNGSLFVSKLAEIDEGIRKFDIVISVKGITSLPEAISPTDYSCPKSLLGIQNSVFPSEPTTINQKENLALQVLCDITNTKPSSIHAPL